MFEGVTKKEIVAAVCAEYGVKPMAIRGRTKTKKVVRARHVSLYLVRKLTGLPYWDFCQPLAGVSTQSARNAFNRIQGELDTDANMVGVLLRIFNRLDIQEEANNVD